MNFVYVLSEGDELTKIGSTRYPKERLDVFKTLYFSHDDKPLEYIKLYMVDKNCYEINELLKDDTNRGFNRLRENGFNNCGEEYYELDEDDLQLLETWFIKNDVEFKSIHIDDILWEKKEDYKSLVEEIFRETDTNNEFIRGLINRNIETEEGYRIEYEPYNNPNFPYDPTKKYIGFQWKDLLIKKYYDLDTCIQRLKELEQDILQQDLLTDLEKNTYLSKKMKYNLYFF
jgi:hypothetical protein